MRLFAASLAVVLIGGAAVATPAPPGLTKEQEEALKSALAELDRARRLEGALQREQMEKFKKGERNRQALGSHREKCIPHYKAAAEKLDRLERDLAGAPREHRELAACRAGLAWYLANECRKALAICDRVLKQSTDPVRRLDALEVAASCHWSLMQREHIAGLIELGRKELPRLKGEERTRAVRWLATVEEWK